jgi:hypothetical protein
MRRSYRVKKSNPVVWVVLLSFCAFLPLASQAAESPQSFKEPLGSQLKLHAAPVPPSMPIRKTLGFKGAPWSPNYQQKYLDGYMDGAQAQSSVLCPKEHPLTQEFASHFMSVKSHLDSLTPQSDLLVLEEAVAYLSGFRQAAEETARKFRLCDGLPTA